MATAVSIKPRCSTSGQFRPAKPNRSAHARALKSYSPWDLEKRFSELVGDLPAASQQRLAWEHPPRLVVQINAAMAKAVDDQNRLPRTRRFAESWRRAQAKTRVAVLDVYQGLRVRHELPQGDLP